MTAFERPRWMGSIKMVKDSEDLSCNEGVAVKSVEKEHTLPNLVIHSSSVIS